MYEGNFEITKQCAHFFGYDWKEIYNAPNMGEIEKGTRSFLNMLSEFYINNILAGKLIWIIVLIHFLFNLIASFILILGSATVSNKLIINAKFILKAHFSE